MRMLIAEDNRFFRRLLESNLKKWGHEVVACDNGAEAWTILQEEDTPKLAILDWDMPGMQGIEICRELRKLKDRPYVYVIMLTAKSKKEDMVEGLESGADDYLTKPVDPIEFRVRVRAATRIVQLQDDLLEANRASELRAKQDSLTGLWNHSAIINLLQNELDRAWRQKTTLGVIMGDLDHFKHINDSHGHLAGDNVLRDAASELKAILRSYDSLGRYGGEEFLIILPDCDGDNLLKLAERLRASIAEKERAYAECNFRCTMSFGLVMVKGTRPHSAEEVIRRADQALYEAKHNGRNCIRLADDALPTVRDTGSCC